MEIVKLKNKQFGTRTIYREVSGYALFESNKGYVAFSHDKDKYGILIPYMPCGGCKALQSILDAGGFVSFEGMEYVTSMN